MVRKLIQRLPSFGPESGISEVDFDGPSKTVSKVGASRETLPASIVERILRQIPLDLWVSSADGDRVCFQSNHSIKTWGDIQGCEIATLDVPTELIGELQNSIDLVLDGRTVLYEMVLPFSAAQKKVFYNKITPVQDGKFDTIGALGIWQNVTEQREKEQLLIARRSLAEQLNKTSDREEALRLGFETALCISHVQKASAFTVDEEGVGTLLFQHGIPMEFLHVFSTIKINDLIKDSAVRCEPLLRMPDEFRPEIAAILHCRNVSQVAILPMRQDGQINALLVVAACSPEKFPSWCLDELQTIASQTEATISRIQTQEQSEADRQLLRQLLRIQEQERQLISSEVHDGFVQEIVGAQMVLGAILQTCQDCDATCFTYFLQASEMLGRAIKKARHFIGELRPLIIEEAGLLEAVDFLINQPDFSPRIEIRYKHNKAIQRFNPIFEEVAFRIIQEGITNAVQHSQGTKIEINLTQNNNLLSINIIDDGIGFEVSEATSRGFGIREMIERASLFGGVATIKSKAEEGTRVLVELPIMRMSDATSSEKSPVA